uniref:Uncharacterized protein n=1 Tax=Parascaris univalens TaxID=6257 RepID=A0A915A3Q9_PARUN
MALRGGCDDEFNTEDSFFHTSHSWPSCNGCGASVLVFISVVPCGITRNRQQKHDKSPNTTYFSHQAYFLRSCHADGLTYMKSR